MTTLKICYNTLYMTMFRYFWVTFIILSSIRLFNKEIPKTSYKLLYINIYLPLPFSLSIICLSETGSGSM